MLVLSLYKAAVTTILTDVAIVYVVSSAASTQPISRKSALVLDRQQLALSSLYAHIQNSV
jgi:hypothetical protein